MSVLWGDGLGVCRSALASLSFLSFKLHQVCSDIKANVSNTPCLLAHQLDPWYLSVVLSNDPDLRNNKFTSAAAVVYMPINQSYDCVLPFTCAVIDGRSFNAVHVVACHLFCSQIMIISKCCTRCCNIAPACDICSCPVMFRASSILDSTYMYPGLQWLIGQLVKRSCPPRTLHPACLLLTPV